MTDQEPQFPFELIKTMYVSFIEILAKLDLV